eukprot:CAMPEP_0185327866 /NCGR_PEP_ID=MMETSP1363-20130426/71999_1 /TAXON_ID=38817 /ORGANISM="Gephyrocapsa oceanica, Strain RCC1303" /LENGTH=177 /DNA_ID=CAMNT_0027926637 /DNA_START=77 /DNA_END=607 /DNA_ORIENTATION=+
MSTTRSTTYTPVSCGGGPTSHGRSRPAPTDICSLSFAEKPLNLTTTAAAPPPPASASSAASTRFTTAPSAQKPRRSHAHSLSPTPSAMPRSSAGAQQAEGPVCAQSCAAQQAGQIQSPSGTIASGFSKHIMWNAALQPSPSQSRISLPSSSSSPPHAWHTSDGPPLSSCPGASSASA